MQLMHAHRTIRVVSRIDAKMQSASEDIDFIFQVSKFGRFKAVNAVVYQYRRHHESKTHNFTPEYATSVINEHCLMVLH